MITRRFAGINGGRSVAGRPGQRHHSPARDRGDKMPSLFKYVTEEKYATDLIENGNIFMQTLSNFHRYEDENVRRDEDDGRLHYAPEGGLPLTFEGKDPAIWDGWRFVSSVKADRVYVYCLSTEKSEELAEKFESPFCVEIHSPPALFGRLMRNVRLRSQLERKRLHHGPVDYRALDAAPIVDWALPEKVAFVKPPEWAWQREYRMLIGKKGAFDVENVDLTLESGPQKRAVFPVMEPLILSLGDLSNWTTLHKF